MQKTNDPVMPSEARVLNSYALSVTVAAALLTVAFLYFLDSHPSSVMVIVFLFLVFPLATMTGFVIAALPCAVALRIVRAFKLGSPFFYAAAGAIVSFLAQLVLATIITWSPIQWYTVEPQSFAEQLRGVLHSLWTVGPVFWLAGVLAALTFWGLAGRHYGALPADQSQ